MKKGKPIPAWFTDARFGMFIHWGLYSMPARHEWVKRREHIRDERYQVYFDLFNPDLFNPKDWAAKAKAAGMKYFVITTKHHEGFCLWDSQYTDYKAPNTPCGKDLLREVVDAFRAEGLHVGFYYSLLDWHHPDFTIDCYHPYNDLPKEEVDKLNATRDMAKYRQYMKDQVRELLTNYGKIDIIWFDFSYPREDGTGKGCDDWDSKGLLDLAYSLQPDIIIDDRLNYPNPYALVTPEQYTPAQPPLDPEGNPRAWEGCQTFSGSWGYHRDESSWKSPKMCIELLIDHVSRGGNLLMNVGPTSRGYLDARVADRLGVFADWMRVNSRAIYGCGQAPFEEPNGCRYTYNPKTNRLYVHVKVWPFRHLHLPGLAGKIRYAQILADGSEVFFSDSANSCGRTATPEGAATLTLPDVQPPSLVPVVELLLKEPAAEKPAPKGKAKAKAPRGRAKKA